MAIIPRDEYSGQQAVEAFQRSPGLDLSPAQGFLLNRVAPFAEAAWQAAQDGEWPAFMEALYQLYVAGLMDGTLPLGVLLGSALEEGEVKHGR